MTLKNHILILFIATLPSFSHADTTNYSATQGEVIAIGHDSFHPGTVIPDGGTFPKALFCNGGNCTVLVAIDMKTAPGTYTEQLITLNGEEEHKQEISIEVLPGTFVEQKLTLPKKYVEPDKETQERIALENGLIRKAFSAPSNPQPLLNRLVRPLQGKITTSFGMKRVLNGQPRSQHSGVDIKAPLGAKVGSVARGRVILTGDYFYNGKSVFIDHGYGIYSMYFHLSEISVAEGDELESGELLGRVGSTGRSTGAHLHFGMKLKKAAIDPLKLIELSQEL